MSKYIRDTTVSVRYDGQDLRFVLQPLLYVDVVRVYSAGEVAMATVPEAASEDGRAAVERERSKQQRLAMVKEYADVLPKYVDVSRSVLPVDAAGATVPLEEMCRVAYFAKLVSFLMDPHFEGALVGDPSVPDDQPSA